MALALVSVDCLLDSATDKTVIPVAVVSCFICLFGIGFNAVNIYLVHNDYEPINL